MSAIFRANVLSQFACLGDACEDTCCQGWSMQVDDATFARYQSDAPDLLQSVEVEDNLRIMRKDPATTFCVKLEGGLCGIHKTNGANFLGDACYFYPRVTRTLGAQVVMTATMSCPEIVRRALLEDVPSAMHKAAAERLPQSIKNYLPPEVAEEDALTVHRAFLHATEDEHASAEQIFLRIASVARWLDRLGKTSWARLAPVYLAEADTHLPAAQMNAADPFNLLHALCGLIVASHKKPSPRLQQTIYDMEQALDVRLDWQQVTINATQHSLEKHQKLSAQWQEHGAQLYAPLLRRWLQMQLSLSLFPYAGLGESLIDRVTIIGVRFATLKLALMCSCDINGAALSQDVVVRLVQSLSRFLDHLGDPAFSTAIYAETGWIHEGRMRGLLGA